MPQRSLSSEFFSSGEAPPSYDTALTPQEFEAKAAAVVEQTRESNGKQVLHDSGPSNGNSARSKQYEEFEDWDDARFEAAAAAYQLRLARMRQGANSSTQPAASSSSNRAQSPRRDNAGRSVPISSRGTSPQHHGSPPSRNSTRSPGQLPHASHSEYNMQRGLPQQPLEVYPSARSTPRPQPPMSSQQMPPPPESDAPPAWMSGASSDGHGRASMEGPPPFAAMDLQMNFSSPPPSVQDHDGPVVPSQPPPDVRERYSVPAPPPLNIPQAPASTPLQPTPQPTRLPSPPNFVPPQSSHRHSDVPSPSVRTANPTPPPRQRASEVPSASGRVSAASNVRTPPPTFNGTHHGFVLSYDKKATFAPQPAEPTSKAAALYASAMSKTSHAPNVRVDLNRLAYHGSGHNQPTPAVKEEAHHPGSFYSSSVSSVMKKRTLPPQPPRRQTNESQYSQFSPQTPQAPPQHNPYALPPGAAPPMPNAFYGHSAQAHPNQTFYTQAHMQSSEMNTQAQGYPPHFSAPQQQQHHQQHQQLHHAPQGYPRTAVQNHWAPTPEMWNNYGQP